MRIFHTPTRHLDTVGQLRRVFTQAHRDRSTILSDRCILKLWTANSDAPDEQTRAEWTVEDMREAVAQERRAVDHAMVMDGLSSLAA